MSTPTTRSPIPLGAWLVLWLAVAAAVCWWAWPQQRQRGCWQGEWPHEDGCAHWPTASLAKDKPEVFAQHLYDNVGDSRAWAKWLGAHANVADSPAGRMLPWVQPLAPYSPQVLLAQAQRGLDEQDWALAAKTLAVMLERGDPQARRPLLGLLLTPEAQAAALAQVGPQSSWPELLLSRLERNVPVTALQPLVSAAVDQGLLTPNTQLHLIERLKQAGAWLDAYTLWVSLRGSVSVGLYNAGFDQRALRRGFDWVWAEPAANKRGYSVDQVSAAPRPGYMLEVGLTGRAALPTALVTQHLMLTGQRYRLQGRYMADRMRTQEGLVWALRCAGGGARWGATAPIKDTQRRWQSFELVFDVPSECNMAVQLALETAAAWEAKSGMSGHVYLDDLALTPIEMDRQ